ncbi:MAG TPA: hypothetical protein VHU40_22875 [Polyangia bacterium]|nr:hypothetical protein [Polyangia bacterium]
MGLAVLLGLSGGCATTQAGTSGPATVAAQSPRSGPRLLADLAPVTTLAFDEPYLWAGSERGLRRLRLPENQLDWFTTAAGLAGHPVKAVAPAGEGAAWVATDAGVGRVTVNGAEAVFVVNAPLTDVTRIVPQRFGKAVWLGTEHGLFSLEGGGLTPVAGALAKNPITFLAPDEDGQSVWAGVRGRGLFHIDARKKVVAEFGPGGPGHVDFVDVVGRAIFANGTPIALGRGRDGATRLIVLRPDAPLVMVPDAPLAVLGLVATDEGPVLLAGNAQSPSLMTLAMIARGESAGTDGLRFTPVPRNLDSYRIVARPDGRAVPGEVTAWTVNGNELFVGTRAAGVARVASAGKPPAYLPTGELAWKASELSVACLERERCVFATGAGPGWIWDGASDTIRPVPAEAMGSPLMALSGDGDSAVYFLAGDGPKGIKVARLSADGDRWDPLVTVQAQTEGAPVVSYATVSPEGNLWLSVRDRAPSGEELGAGVIEVRLPSGQSIHHRAARKGEPRRADAIPVPGDVRAVRFEKETAASPGGIWFCTSMGVTRWAGGKLARWSENDGLSSDSCDDLVVEPDGGVWVATHDGPARFDGKSWFPFSGDPASEGAPRRWPRSGREDEARNEDPAAARALIQVGGKLWAGSPFGVWPLSGAGRVLDKQSGLIDDDVVDLSLDRFGRLWVLGHLGLTITDTFPQP